MPIELATRREFLALLAAMGLLSPPRRTSGHTRNPLADPGLLGVTAHPLPRCHCEVDAGEHRGVGEV